MFNIVKFFLNIVFTISPLLIGSSSNWLSVTAKLVLYGYSLFLIVFALVNIKSFKVKLNFIFFIIILFSLYLILRSDTMHGLAMALQFILLLIICVLYNGRSLPFISFNPWMLFSIALFSSFLELLSPGLVFANKNYWSVMLLLYMIPVLFVVRSEILLALLVSFSMFLLVVSGSRAVLISMLISYILVFHFIAVKFDYKKVMKLFILMVFVWFSLGLAQSIYQNIDYYNAIFLDLTGKRLESGRIDIWMVLLNHLTFLDVIFGKGGGVDVGNVINEKLSAHSNYVYLIFTYGVIGLIMFLSVCFLLLSHLKKEKMYISMFFSLALLFRDFFEVSLVHNNYPIAFFFWIIFLTSSLELKLRKYNETSITRYG
ncbi:O-antigen ligase family protein [Vibrio parahaemolyticus]|nr:O-antigen ligase family protein [Vibrio parahaemolyticus]EGY8742753.1 O-antigen ligase family protein [Vibrio parahaemolyticus]EHE6934327.1 O-antigen ligase family protein [Vibrio parahaemolyticus]MBE5144232.1 O-antigen ligase family protein [Vibrio parahaemolyticus]